MSSFHVDGRISVKMEIGLAVRLGEFLVKSNPADKQLAAFGWKLIRLEEEEEDETPYESGKNWMPKQHSVPSIESDSEWKPRNIEPRVSVNKSMHDKVDGIKRAEKIRWGHSS